MAYRKIHDSFWTDPDIEELTPEQKYFYLYLITNPNVNQLGLYEFSVRRACFETGYNEETVRKLLDKFEEMGKIKRSDTTKELLVVKFYHHNKSNSPKVQKHIESLIEEVKDTALIQYIYGMDTLSQEEEEKEEAQEEGNKPPRYEIPTQDQVEAYFCDKGDMLEDDIPLEAEKFINHYAALDWRTNKGRGKRIKNWHRQAGTWLANYKKWNKDRVKRKQEQERQPEYMKEL